MKFGILKETKIPTDNRCALTPNDCKKLLHTYPQLTIHVQPSELRCYKDFEYLEVGCTISENLEMCDVLWGVKEPAIDSLISNKTYVLFSHTKKKQAYNRDLLLAFLEKNIRLVDYECLVDEAGDRILGFGNWAGVVGAHEGLLQYGNRTKTFSLPPAYSVKDYEALKEIYKNINLPAIKIVLTGSGRVAQGILEIMNQLKIEEVSPSEFIQKKYEHAVFTQIKGSTLYAHKIDNTYDRMEFHNYPENYQCLFETYAFSADILINGIYWDKNIPRLFDVEDVQNPLWKIKTIADITCDANGSVPITIKYTTITDPVFGFSKTELKETKVYAEDAIDIISVDNLPNELPRDASDFFSDKIISLVVPEFLNNESDLLYRATITQNRELNTPFAYLDDFAYPNKLVIN